MSVAADKVQIQVSDRPLRCSRCPSLLGSNEATLTIEWRGQVFIYCNECRLQMEKPE